MMVDERTAHPRHSGGSASMSSLSGNLVTQLPTDFAGEQPRKPEVPKPIAVIDGTAINIGHQPELIDQIIASALACRKGTVMCRAFS